jgi:hypothetical protein
MWLNKLRRKKPAPWIRPTDTALALGQSPVDTLQILREWTAAGNYYARRLKNRLRIRATVLRLLSVGLSAFSAVILGIQDLDLWGDLGFVAVTLATILVGLEGFFNWRSRWVSAEELQYRFYKLQDDLEFLAASKSVGELSHDDVEMIYKEYVKAWDSFSGQWLDERRRAAPPGV